MTQQQQPPAFNPWDHGKPPEKPKPFRFKWLVILAAILVFLGISYAVAVRQGFRWDKALHLNARYLSDGFFAVGLVVAGVGALVWIATTGFFDIFSYAFRSMLVMFTPFVKPEKFPKFYDYKNSRMERRQKTNFIVLFIGLAFIVLSLVMLFIYYQTQPPA